MDEDTPASRLQLPPGPWATLLDGLCARFPAIPRAAWIDRFARGRVQDAAGRALHGDDAWRAGLEIRYYREVVDEPRLPVQETVLHVDDHLVVADKPHGLPVVPAGGFVRETLLRRLVDRLGNPDLVPLHRLDRATAGLVLFSVDPASRAAYQDLFRERRIAKGYEALAPALPDMTFPLVRRSRIERGEPFFRMREVAGEANSETHIDVLARDGDQWTYALSPVTGRKHQLRVHMAAIGAPVANDCWYPDLLPQAAGDDVEALARPLRLVARSLAFADPVTGEVREFVSGMPLGG